MDNPETDPTSVIRHTYEDKQNKNNTENRKDEQHGPH